MSATVEQDEVPFAVRPRAGAADEDRARAARARGAPSVFGRDRLAAEAWWLLSRTRPSARARGRARGWHAAAPDGWRAGLDSPRPGWRNRRAGARTRFGQPCGDCAGRRWGRAGARGPLPKAGDRGTVRRLHRARQQGCRAAWPRCSSPNSTGFAPTLKPTRSRPRSGSSACGGFGRGKESQKDAARFLTASSDGLSNALEGVVSSDAKIGVGLVTIPIGPLLSLCNRLVSGSRLHGSVHHSAARGRLILTAQLVGGPVTGCWRVDAPYESDAVTERACLDAMVRELAPFPQLSWGRGARRGVFCWGWAVSRLLGGGFVVATLGVRWAWFRPPGSVGLWQHVRQRNEGEARRARLHVCSAGRGVP